MAEAERCRPCQGTGIYPLDIPRLRTTPTAYLRGCGACGGTGWWL